MRNRTIFYVYGILVLVYLSLVLILPPNPVSLERYGLTAATLRLVSLAVAFPLAAIWLTAFYGYAKLKSYSELIQASPEGRPVSMIVKGLAALTFGLPITSIISLILRYIAQRNEDFLTVSTIIINYTSLLFPLIAFICISIGTRGLTGLKRQRPPQYAAHGLMLLFAVMSVGYSYLVVHFAFLGQSSRSAIYFMPLWLAMISIVVPYVYMWFVGLMAAYEMYLYNSTVKGVLYRRSWSLLSWGLGVVVVSLISIQCLTTLSAQLERLSIVSLLGVVYGLLILMTAGYVLIAYGAKRLQKIEEV